MMPHGRRVQGRTAVRSYDMRRYNYFMLTRLHDFSPPTIDKFLRSNILRVAALKFLWCFLIALPVSAQVISETDSAITVVGSVYSFSLQKSNAQCSLNDEHGNLYCTFPMWADAAPIGYQENVNFAWTISDSIISYTASDDTGAARVQCIITCSADVFRVDFQVRVPDTLQFMRYHQGWGVMNTYHSNGSENPPFSIAGHHYTTGIWTHAPSEIIVPLPQHAKTFLSDCGREDSEQYPSQIQFIVNVDDTERYRSPIMSYYDSAQHINVNVSGAKFITLTVFQCFDGIAHDHADWANPRIVTDQGDTIDFALLVRYDRQGLNYFSFNQSTMQFPNGYVSIIDPAPDCSWATMYNRAQITAQPDYYCGYAFNPPPGILSFYSNATQSWMGMGLTATPDAGIVEFMQNCLIMNIQWAKLQATQHAWYAAPGLYFVFDNIPQHNIDHYYQQLLSHGEITEPRNRFYNHPQWWDHLSVCPWGDQDILDVHNQHWDQSWVSNYLLRAEQLYHDTTFTFIIDTQWRRWDSDAQVDSSHYPDLRGLIDTLHRRGHHVLLQYPFWPANDSSMACTLGICQAGACPACATIDATNAQFPHYADSVLHMMLDSSGLNADGLKMDFLSVVRNPESGNYFNAKNGMGMQEQAYAANIWIAAAKRVKPDCLLTYTIANPFFNMIPDKIRMNDNGYRWNLYQQRARTASQASPYNIIDSDGWQLKHDDLEPYYFGACVFGTPTMLYMDAYRDMPAVDSTEQLLSKLFSVYRFKQPGVPQFKEPDGSWRSVRGDTVTSETLDSNTVFVVRANADTSYVLLRASTIAVIPLHGQRLQSIVDESGMNQMYYVDSDNVVASLSRGVIYTLNFDSTLSVTIPPTPTGLSLYPIPATSEINAVSIAGTPHVTFYDIRGEAFSLPIKAMGPSYKIFSTAQVAPGFYYAKIFTDNNFRAVPFVVLPH